MLQSRSGGKRDEAGLGSDVVPARGLSASETWTWIMIAAGVFLRVLEYSDNRQLYCDEEDLQANLVGFAFYDFHTPLVRWQLAPPGFLAVERLMILLPLPFRFAARLVPFVCSIASMFLMRSVARRFLTAAAVPIAVGLFALVDWMLYYSVELKQYSSDVTLTLTALLLAARATRSYEGRPLETSRRDFIMLAAFGAIGVWFSHPLALVLAGAGTYLILNAASRREWHRALAFLAMSLAWAVNFAGCYRISQRLVAKDGFLETWWKFAYLPFPPSSFADLAQIFWHSINLVNSPSGVLTPLGLLPSAFIGAGLFLLGSWSLGRRWKGGLFLLVAPILLALAASMLRRYPFHGRLLLFLIPSVHLLVGEGAAALARGRNAKLTFVLGAFLLAQPVLDVLWHRLVMKRNHTEYDSHGDLHRDVLDYLDLLEKIKKRDEMLRKLNANRLDGDEGMQAGGQGPTGPP
jgi:Dolichyl-phosphate-mannose-protein mannosyltransferase